jgi:hypothetical protein
VAIGFGPFRCQFRFSNRFVLLAQLQKLSWRVVLNRSPPIFASRANTCLGILANKNELIHFPFLPVWPTPPLRAFRIADREPAAFQLARPFSLRRPRQAATLVSAS